MAAEALSKYNRIINNAYAMVSKRGGDSDNDGC